MDQMEPEVAEALRREFGYVPNADDGEKWVVYHDHALVVIHPARPVRVYKRGASGASDYCELDPTPWC